MLLIAITAKDYACKGDTNDILRLAIYCCQEIPNRDEEGY